MLNAEQNHGVSGNPSAVPNKAITIVINGTPYGDIPKKEDITYAEVVALAYPGDTQSTFSVTYTRGQSNKPEGILSPGGSVKVKEGMAFSVDRTGQS